MARVKKAEVNIEGTTMTLAFAHGEELVCDASELPNEQKQNTLVHGMKQKVCDSYSGVTTPAEALEKAKAVWEGLLNNMWTIRTAGEGGARVTQLAQALANATGRAIEECVERIGSMDDNQKKQLAANPQIKSALADIQAAKAAEAKAAAEAEAADGPSIADILEGNLEDDSEAA